MHNRDTFYWTLRALVVVAGLCAACAVRAADMLASGTAAPTSYVPPAGNTIPYGRAGSAVRFGERIFVDTRRNAGRYVGNALNCSNCHLDQGRKSGAAPVWAAALLLPESDRRTAETTTFARRLQRCFENSMNGSAPRADDPILVALQSYARWLAGNATREQAVAQRGFPELGAPPLTADFARGNAVYMQRCASCHGVNGEGKVDRGKTVFPPLWGAQSFNWGAGMHRIDVAAAFIKANMPFGMDCTLTDQQAWDVAKFVDSHERPQDPRFDGSIERTRARYHDSPNSMYGRTVDGHLLGSVAGHSRVSTHPVSAH